MNSNLLPNAKTARKLSCEARRDADNEAFEAAKRSLIKAIRTAIANGRSYLEVYMKRTYSDALIKMLEDKQYNVDYRISENYITLKIDWTIPKDL